MPTKMKRTQILFSEADYRRLQEEAKARDCSMGQVVREAVRRAYPEASGRARKAALKQLASLKAPVDDWEEMEAQIERGAIDD